MNRDQLPFPDPEPSSTAEKVADAAHFLAMASSFAAFLAAADRARPLDEFQTEQVRASYHDLCHVLADAQRLTGNREPEMAEAIAQLQRLKEEHRELID